MTVRLGTTAEAVTANDASEAAASRGSNDVNKLFVIEDVDQNTVASLDRDCLFAFYRLDRLESNFLDHPDRRNVRLGEMTSHGLVDFRCLDEIDVADLGGVITVPCEGLELGDDAWSGLKHGDRVDVATIIEDLSHADLFSENSDY